MSNATLPPPIWVETPTALLEVAANLQRQPRLAVDTEANSLHAYREKVCLLQISTPEQDYLLDPLALPDLSPLAPVFSDPRIEKVFHAAEYDLLGLQRDFGFEVCSIFDTRQAARLLGYRQVGLNALLAACFGLQVDKSCQKADWARRPLPPEWQEYARADTHYLLPLRDLLQRQLQACDRLGWAQEEFARLTRLKRNDAPALPLWQRLNGAQEMDGRQLAILKELCLWREREAQRLDRPVFKIIGEQTLVALAQRAPQTSHELKEAGLTERQVRCFGREILAAIRRGLQSPPIPRVWSARPAQDYLDRLERLRRWRQATGKRLGVESDLVLPREFMCAIAERPPHSMDELAALMQDSPWRLQRFGADILHLLRQNS